MAPAFLRLFRDRAGSEGAMTFARFMELALYDSEAGYYRRNRGRVGYGGETDFFTASTSGAIFGELIVAACLRLLGQHSPGDYRFIEIGAEPGAGVLRGIAHPFREVHTVHFGETPTFPDRCVVFSNELFDAQPFHRFVFRQGAWREIGVALRGVELVEVEFERATPAPLPEIAPEGYRLDLSLAATTLAEKIAAPGWSGLFVACDYGKSWRELSEATPNGTARAYHRHTQSNALLAAPGEQDLTAHVCWDWLVAALERNRFQRATVESQEAFFVRHAADFIAKVTAAEAAHFSSKKQSLMQLLHPAHLGQKFQVLHAWRDV